MNQETIIQEILEVVQFLKDHGATSQEVNEVRAEVGEVRAELGQFRRDVDNRFVTMRSEIIGHVDGLVVLHQKLDTELAALRAKYDRLEGFVKQLATHANITLEY
jgi:hypothetical protein